MKQINDIPDEHSLGLLSKIGTSLPHNCYYYRSKTAPERPKQRFAAIFET